VTPDPGQRPDPEDGAHTVPVYWTLRACELLGALIFSTALPWQQAFTWFALVAGFGSWRWWHVTRPQFKALPTTRRRLIYRLCVWTSMFLVGSAWYFLYVPGNQVMMVVLAIYLMGSAALVALRVTGDFARTVVAVCLTVLPTSARFFVEGLQGNLLLVLLGIGGVLMTISIVQMSRVQERMLLQQYELRQRAERAATAVAAVGLAKSRFFAAVSHDLRQPVHAIGLYLDPLVKLAQRAQDEPAQHAAEGIRQSWRALDDLLSQVLDLTRMDSGVVTAELQSTEIAPLVRSLVMQHSATAERAGVRIVALVQPGRFAVADELMLKRVLSNLLDNAIKFSPTERTVAVTLRSGQGVWRLQVRDAGPGIALAEQGKIFEEFVQLGNDARDRRQGLGLGLAISKRFTQLMGGSLSVRSEPGCGCCMTIELPKAQARWLEADREDDFDDLDMHDNPAIRRDSRPDSRPYPASAAPEPAPWPGMTELASAIAPHPLDASALTMPAWPEQDVLLLEDDYLVSNAMCQLLRSWGQRVHPVQTAAQALEQADSCTLAICDVRLPHGASGLDVALQLRARGKKVLLLSGETDAALREAACEHQLLLLTKPVSSAQMLLALQSL
jgi:two-component system, sensor histidine kinase